MLQILYQEPRQYNITIILFRKSSTIVTKEKTLVRLPANDLVQLGELRKKRTTTKDSRGLRVMLLHWREV